MAVESRQRRIINPLGSGISIGGGQDIAWCPAKHSRHRTPVHCGASSGSTCACAVGRATALSSSTRITGALPTPVTSGAIILQSEGAEVFYRDIAMRSITAIPAEYAEQERALDDRALRAHVRLCATTFPTARGIHPMAYLGRLGDISQSAADAHGCPGCPHPVSGPAIAGSPSVRVNGRPALRVGDAGVHGSCCGPNMWNAQVGSATVFINGKGAHRQGDAVKHCGSIGRLINGSPDVSAGG